MSKHKTHKSTAITSAAPSKGAEPSARDSYSTGSVPAGGLNIRAKLGLSFAVMLAILIATGLLSVSRLNSLSGISDELGAKTLPAVRGLANAANTLGTIRATQYRELADREGQAATVARRAKLTETLSQFLTDADSHLETPASEKVLKEFKESWRSYMTLADAALAKADAGGGAEAVSLLSNAVSTFDEARSKLDSLMEDEFALSKAMVAGARAESNTATTLTWAALGIGALVSIGVSWMVSRSIAGRLALVTERAQAIANADLSAQQLPITSGDEIGQLAGAVNDMSRSLHSMVKSVSETSQGVAAAATQIAASAEQMAGTLKHQEDSASQVAAAVAEMSASIAEVADKSGGAAQSAQSAGSQANQGGDVVTKTVNEMVEIKQEVNAAAAQVGELAAKADSIGQVLSVISDIADQTNLLALNAAIEAARAGEHGRGFAVVADEVRKLAERTQQATQEVARSVNAIQEGTKGAVEKIQGCTERVGRGSELAKNAGEALKQIVSGSNDVRVAIESISAAAQQQSTASEEVSRSMEQIRSGTRESSEAAQQASQAASALSQQSERLREIVNRFRM